MEAKGHFGRIAKQPVGFGRRERLGEKNQEPGGLQEL
jgi:hypothetical protein